MKTDIALRCTGYITKVKKVIGCLISQKTDFDHKNILFHILNYCNSFLSSFSFLLIKSCNCPKFTI